MKRSFYGKGLHKLTEFPPVNSGGLIEAWSAAREAGSGGSFPPVNSGGLIEAARGRT